MRAQAKEIPMPTGYEPYDKEWPIGVSGMAADPSPFARINRLREFAIGQEFTVDHQRACLVTEAYQLHSDKSQIIKCALALAHVLANVKINIFPSTTILPCNYCTA